MSEIIRRHVSQHPHARATTIRHGHVAVQSEKIEAYQALHKQYPQRGGHYRDRVTSQLMVAA